MKNEMNMIDITNFSDEDLDELLSINSEDEVIFEDRARSNAQIFALKHIIERLTGREVSAAWLNGISADDSGPSNEIDDTYEGAILDRQDRAVNWI